MASFQLKRVSMVSHRSNKTDRLITDPQRSFLGSYKLLMQHYCGTAADYAIVCNMHSCGYSTCMAW